MTASESPSLPQRDELREEEPLTEGGFRYSDRAKVLCRTCMNEIWWEVGEVDHREKVGWSDRVKRGGDSLVCFKAVGFRHVPLTDREWAYYEAGQKSVAARRDDLAERVARVEVLADVVRRLQKPDPDTGDRDVSFFALMEALYPDRAALTSDRAATEGPCGEPRRYFPQQTCALPRGHAGDHEDDTHLWENAAPAALADPTEAATSEEGR